MKQVKDCKHRTKAGRCEKGNHLCCFSPRDALICIADKPSSKKRRRRK